MTQSLKQQVIIENAAGAGGTIGSAKVAKARPDGYTLLFTHISHATNPALYRKLPYDTMKDFDPIGLVAELPMTFVAKKEFPPNNFKELVAYLKANKDKIVLRSRRHRLGFASLRAAASDRHPDQRHHRRYKGTGPAMNDLMGGQVDFMCDQTVNTCRTSKPGSSRSTASRAPSASPQLPDVPTLQEAGLPNFELSIWYGLYAPEGNAQAGHRQARRGIAEAVKDENTCTGLPLLGAEPVSPESATPEALRAQVKSEIDKWGPIIKQAGVYAD